VEIDLDDEWEEEFGGIFDKEEEGQEDPEPVDECHDCTGSCEGICAACCEG
jgi:hypothetical protein